MNLKAIIKRKVNDRAVLAAAYATMVYGQTLFAADDPSLQSSHLTLAQ